jgi:hypothetical protein
MGMNKAPFDIYEIRQLIEKSPSNFIKELNDVFSNEGLTRAIELIKVSGICYSIFGKNKNNGIFQQALKLLIDTHGNDNDEVKRLLDEISYFDELFKDFYRLMSKVEFDKISKEDQVSYFLVASESLLSALVEYTANVDWSIIAKKYPVAKRPVNIRREPLDPIKDLLELSSMYENYAGYIGKILTYFYYQEMPFKGSDKILSADVLQIASRHLQLFDLFDRLSFLYENWRYVNCILKRENNVICFSPIDEDDYMARGISLDRFNHLKNQNTIEFIKKISHLSFQPTTSELFPKGLRSFSEVFSALLCEDLLGSYDLWQEVLGVRISEWLRAFSILVETGQRFIKERKAGTSLSVKDWCIIRDKKVWIDEFVKEGIVAENAEIIIDTLIFAPGAEDIFDCPFIPFENKLLCLPVVIANLDASQSLLSNFSTKEIDISFKGKRFEDNVTEIIRNAGIPVFNLYEKKCDREYQCDITFLISNEIYFVECKSFIQPRKPKEYYELLVKACEASKQLSRIAEHFLKHSDILRKQIGTQLEWPPYKIHKIILSKANFGTPLFMNDCYIVDSSVFITFFERKNFAIIEEDNQITIPVPVFTGPITNEKLLCCIQDPPQIKFIRNNRIKREYQVNFSDYKLRFPEFEEKVPLFGFYKEKE